MKGKKKKKILSVGYDTDSDDIDYDDEVVNQYPILET